MIMFCCLLLIDFIAGYRTLSMNTVSTKKTWLQLRSAQAVCEWSQGVWFTQYTPKYSFLVWVALRQRLQTCDRINRWNATANTACVLCDAADETCHHLFFTCNYSKQIWKSLAGGILQNAFCKTRSRQTRPRSMPHVARPIH